MDFEKKLMNAIESNNSKAILMIGIDEYTANERFSKVTQIPQKTGELRLPSVSYPTPLIYAICCRAYQSVKELINLGANLLKGVQGWDPIHFAVLSHDIQIVKLLLSKDQKLILAKSSNGSSLLHFAVSSSDYQMVAFLLSVGADVKATNNLKQTPFLISMACNDINIVKALVAFSSKLDVKDSKGRTYKEIGMARGKVDYVQYINNIINNKEVPLTKEEILSTIQIDEPEFEEQINCEEISTAAQLDELEKHIQELEKKV